MKIRIPKLLVGLPWLALSTLNFQPATAFAQGTAFTYQGQLQNNGSPASGTYNLTFSLFDVAASGTPIAGPVTNNAVVITNGLFTALINFAPGVFSGQTNWLQIGVASNGLSTFTNLSPRQQLTPTPYAIYAEGTSNLLGTLPVAQLSGTVPLAQLPAAVVTNNEANVTLGNVTLTGTLNLPSAGTINAGNNSLLYADGADDFYAGPGAGSVAISASDSTGIGYGALSSNSNGVNNTAIGYESLNNNTNGSFNVASGGRALFSNTSGNNNTADGRRALEDNTSGSDNTAIGYEALATDTSGSQNTAVGSSALGSSAGGSNNIALGYGAGGNFTGGASSNIDIGNPGVSVDNNIIRIGSGQTSAFIAGVINGNGGGLTDLNASQLSGAISLALLPSAVVTNNDSASITLSGTFSGNGAGLTGVNAAELGGLSSAGFWKTNGNAGANPTNGTFLGTTDNNPFEIHVDGTRGWRMEPDSRGDSVPTLIGGYVANAVLQPGSGGDFIGGGGFSSIPNLINSNSSGIFIGAGSGNQVGPNVNDAVLAGGNGNVIHSPDSVVGGGVNNVIGTNAQYAFIGGGNNNTNTAIGGTVGGGAYNYSSGNSYGYSTVCGGLSNICGSFATVAGGYGNTAGGFGSFIGGGGFATATGLANNNYFGNTASGQASTIGGGFGNDASGPGSFIGGGGFDGNAVDDLEEGNAASGGGDVIGGGVANEAAGLDSTVGGGFQNGASGNYAVVPGGYYNAADGDFSFAAGDVAAANFDYSFVWSDGSAYTQDTGANQFVARASGGFFFYSGAGTTGAELPHGSGSWSSMSDRNAKNNFAQVAPETVLARVASLPISTWSYKTEQGVRHIGPMAQEFYAAFAVGEDDRHIADVDEGGVALAAIQGLNQKMEAQLKEKDNEIAALKHQNDSLAKQLNELASAVQSLEEKNQDTK
jgi:hypothetical protein